MRKPLKISVLFVVALIVVMLLVQLPSVTTKYQAKQFASYDELSNFLKTRTETRYYGGMMVEAMAGAAQTAVPMATVSKAGEYSTTNIQVAGVDEPDIVKTDGKYIYTANRNNITIVDAYPAEGMKITSRIQVDGSVSNIFVNGDKLIVFGTKYGYRGGPYPVMEGVRISPYYSRGSSFVHVYNIADRTNPVLVRNLTLDGSYNDARMIGDYVYAIVQQPVRMLEGEPVLPAVTVGSETKSVAADQIVYFDAHDTSFVYTFVIALNTQNDNEQPTEKVFLLGYSQNLYVSQDNIYTVHTKYMSWDERNLLLIERAIVPNVPFELQIKIRKIQAQNTTDGEKMSLVGDLLQDYVAGLGPEGGAKFMRTLEEKMQTVMVEIEKESEKTVIHKIGISGPSIDYKVSGEVPGRVLNQFSMDEYDGNFRIATTTGRSWGGTSLNHVYVLNQELNIIGRLENLAPKEQIYSARFMGERAYLVTFVRTDPLFVIDLSNPFAPAVLGELKIPGFSEYLHPYDANHLIGVGQMTDENGRRTGQVKLALFDVTDVANPKEISTYLIGETGDWVYSEALDDHKAFLFSRPKKLLSIPVSVNNWRADKYVQGAYVFDLTVEDGFVLKGKVTHKTANASEEEHYYDRDTAVRRSLYMDNILYTVSGSLIKANNLADLEEISEVRLD